MSQIRRAHSVEIIDKRLRDAEVGGDVDAMELIGLHDELARVERKWVEKAERLRVDPGGRPPGNADQLNLRFDRLVRLVEAYLRRVGLAGGEREAVEKVGRALAMRKALPPLGAK